MGSWGVRNALKHVAAWIRMHARPAHRGKTCLNGAIGTELRSDRRTRKAASVDPDQSGSVNSNA
jgi:hypothetical protein